MQAKGGTVIAQLYLMLMGGETTPSTQMNGQRMDQAMRIRYVRFLGFPLNHSSKLLKFYELERCACGYLFFYETREYGYLFFYETEICSFFPS